MTTLADIFQLDGNNNIIITNEVLSIPIFASIWRRTTRIEGDSAGALKKYATMELNFIYHCVHYKSRLSQYGVNSLERRKAAAEYVGLNNVIYTELGKGNRPRPYVIRPDVKEGIKEYISLVYDNPTAVLFKNLKEALYNGIEVVRYMNDRINKRLLDVKLQIAELEKELEDTVGEEMRSSLRDRIRSIEDSVLTSLFQSMSELKKYSNDLPPTIKTIDKVEEDLKKIEQQKIYISGNKILPVSAKRKNERN